MKGLEYGMESTTLVSVSVTDVDEVPEFAMDILELSVPENTSKGSELLVVEAADPEGKEIGLASTHTDSSLKEQYMSVLSQMCSSSLVPLNQHLVFQSFYSSRF